MARSTIGCALGATLLAVTLVAELALASGSYTQTPLRAPGARDSARYELGKHVFQGSIALEAASQARDEQLRELEALQAKLPRAARTRASLPELAGRLSDEQLEALRYYMKVRYRVK